MGEEYGGAGNGADVTGRRLRRDRRKDETGETQEKKEEELDED